MNFRILVAETRYFSSIHIMIEATYANDSLVIKILSNELEMYTVPALKSEITDTLGRKPRLVVFNLEAVECIDSSAIGAFFYFNKFVKGYGGKLILAQLTEQVSAILRATQSLGLLPVSNTVTEALASTTASNPAVA